MGLPSSLSALPVPLGITAGVLAAGFSLWGFLHSEFVEAQEYRAFKQTVESRALTRDKTQLETEILKLEVKKDTYPAKFDAIDKAMLAKHKADLAEVKQDIKVVQQQLQQVPK